MAKFNRKVLAQRYYELCDKRDSVNASLTELQAQLTEANEACEQWRVRAVEIAAQIQEKRGGGQAWLDLKHEIADIARFFGTVPPRE